jgi:hypothetical protein
MEGEFTSYTLDGPPERITPLGSICVVMESHVDEADTSVEYTLRSRILLAMRWLY